VNTAGLIRRLEKLEANRVSNVIVVRTPSGVRHRFKSAELPTLCAAAVLGGVSEVSTILQTAITDNKLIQLLQMVINSEGVNE
jgi:hypothetical protein